MPSTRFALVRACLLVALASLASPADAARVCKPLEGGPIFTGQPTRDLARSGAITVWSGDVARKYGLIYANWANATDKKYNCRRYTTPLGLNAWRCGVRAKPCYLE